MEVFMHTRAYDQGGNRRPMHRLEIGDVVQWKRNGEVGVRWGLVTALSPECKRPIRILPCSYDLKPNGGRERWIGAASILRISDSRGVRKEPLGPEFQPKPNLTVVE